MTTNNRMELTAAIKALEALKGSSEIELYTDSSPVAAQNFINLAEAGFYQEEMITAVLDLARADRSYILDSMENPPFLRKYWQEIATKAGLSADGIAAVSDTLGDEAVARAFRQAFVPVAEHHSTLDEMRTSVDAERAKLQNASSRLSQIRLSSRSPASGRRRRSTRVSSSRDRFPGCEHKWKTHRSQRAPR